VTLPARPTHPEPERSRRVPAKDVTVDRTGVPGHAGGGLPAAGVGARQPSVVDGPPIPGAPTTGTGVTTCTPTPDRMFAALHQEPFCVGVRR